MGEITSSFNQSRSKTDSTQTTREAAGEAQLTEQQQGTINKTLPGYETLTQTGLSTLENILSGNNLPGFLNRLKEGISPDVTNSIVQKSLEDIRPGLQASGIYDSGIRADLESRTAADVRRQSEETNLGYIQNLLQLALGGVPALSNNVFSQQQLLADRLAGLRQINNQSRGRTTEYGITSKLDTGYLSPNKNK